MKTAKFLKKLLACTMAVGPVSYTHLAVEGIQPPLLRAVSAALDQHAAGLCTAGLHHLQLGIFHHDAGGGQRTPADDFGGF